jgi:hypothetical protein
MAAARHASKMNTKDCMVITGAGDSPLSQHARKNHWQVLKLLPELRGFVATGGLLSTVSALAAILTTEDEVLELRAHFEQSKLYDLFAASNRTASYEAEGFHPTIDMPSQHIVALGSGWAWPAVIDFESKIVEGGVCTIEISELKNYTHGRYISAFHNRQNRHFVIFKTPNDRELVDFFVKRLKRYFDITVLETSYDGVFGGVNLLIQELFLAKYLGTKAGKDLSKPRYPPEARGLYGWRPISESKPTL